MDAASINYPRYKEEFDQIKAGPDGIYILSTFEEHANSMTMFGTHLEIKVAMDVYSCNFRIYSSSGSYDLRALRGAHKLPTYYLGHIEKPVPHYVAVLANSRRLSRSPSPVNGKRRRTEQNYSELSRFGRS